jgi:hypothetical protein
VELFCYTQDELTRVPLARRALSEAKWLASRDGPDPGT